VPSFIDISYLPGGAEFMLTGERRKHSPETVPLSLQTVHNPMAKTRLAFCQLADTFERVETTVVNADETRQSGVAPILAANSN
jgi:hypothetical protein